MMIELHEVSRHCGKHTVVSGLTTSIGRGEIFGLLGTSDAGKSTTIKMLATPRHGAAAARRALARIDDDADPRLDLAARHALIWFLNDAGQSRQALDLLAGARPPHRSLRRPGRSTG